MTMENKRLLGAATPPPAANEGVRVLHIGSKQAASVELHAVLARLPDVTIETLTSIKGLPSTIQKSTPAPDLVLVDINPDNPEDLIVLRDLRKIPGMERISVVAVLDKVADQAPLRAMRAGADDVLVTPIDVKEAREVFSRAIEHPRAQRAAPAPLGKTIVFMHLAGGAGATTLAVNAASSLARASKTKKTCLIDLDIQFGNAASLLDLPSASPVQGFVDDPKRLDIEMLEGMMLRHPTGLSVLTAPRGLLPVSVYTAEGITSLLGLAKRRFGFVVLDLPVALASWTDAVLKTADSIYLVVPLSVPSAHRLIKFLDLLREEGIVDLPLKLVGNRYHHGRRRGNDISVAQFEKATGKKLDFLIPNDFSLISLSHDQGKPAVRLQPNSAFTSALTEMLAKDLGNDVFARQRRGFFSFGKA